MLLKFLISFFLILHFCFAQNDDISEACIRCLCHARTGCYQLKNCAKYSINRDYWVTAGRPTFLDDTPNDADAYNNCVKDDGCIIRTITGYINAVGILDCNCDDQITCKDYFATHLHGAACNKNIPKNYLTRFDKCVKDKRLQNSAGWSIPASCTPQSLFGEAPPPV